MIQSISYKKGLVNNQRNIGSKCFEQNIDSDIRSSPYFLMPRRLQRCEEISGSEWPLIDARKAIRFSMFTRQSLGLLSGQKGLITP